MTTWRAYVAGVLAWSVMVTAVLGLVDEHGATPLWALVVDAVGGAAIMLWCRALHRRNGAPR